MTKAKMCWECGWVGRHAYWCSQKPKKKPKYQECTEPLDDEALALRLAGSGAEEALRDGCKRTN